MSRLLIFVVKSQNVHVLTRENKKKTAEVLRGQFATSRPHARRAVKPQTWVAIPAYPGDPRGDPGSWPRPAKGHQIGHQNATGADEWRPST
jgi:hypothetical protein